MTERERENHLRWLMRKGYVEITLSWELKLGERADLAVEMARRDPEMSWGWMHVPGNGDWYLLTANFADAKIRLGGGWTAEQANVLTALLRETAIGPECGPPAPFAYAGWGNEHPSDHPRVRS